MTAALEPAAAAGVDFGLSQEQELLRQEVRRFAEERIRPGVAEREAKREFPLEIFRELGAMGLLGCFVPERWGGAGFDQVSYVVAIEELARVCPSVAVTVSVTNSVCCWPILEYGSDELRDRALRELAGGEAIGGFGLTEPSSGSDVASLRTRARREADEWVLDGEKAWITNAGYARWYVVLARTGEAGAHGISAFVVPADAPGFSAGAAEHKMGLRASHTAAIYFNSCRIPAGNLLGVEGQGFKIAMATLDHSRLGIAAQAVGIHQRALELAVGYARERRQFGKPIAEHQAIQMKLAQMATELEAARALTRAAASLADSGSKDAPRFASQAKLYASEAANRACWESLQIHGGNGFSDEYEISRLYRDVRVTAIYEGTSEMQRLVIARRLLRG
ncbi:MAG TPA: acyl-CoA dehydrogenase family protein [Thermoanaerobaculia bacterium]|nr:acyl-CoA dehydrogenase family protein [Thermoanaerobaculia bacterium]